MNALNNFHSTGRNEMYGLDYGFSPGTHVPPLDYSQPSLPHLHHPKFSSLSGLSEGVSMTGFLNHTSGMDTELYNLLMNAPEKDFPVELAGVIPSTSILTSLNKGVPSSEKDISYAASPSTASFEQQVGSSLASVPQAEGKNRTSRKRRLAQTMNVSPPNNTTKTSSTSNTNIEMYDEGPDDSEDVGTRDDQAKRIRRLVKNREAAQLFRQRQKAYISDLEVKVDKLSTENVTLQSKVDLLSAENKLIKEQLGYLRNFISQVTMTLPFSQTQQVRETGFARKIGFDSKYQ